MDSAQNLIENPATKFEYNDKIEQQLKKFGIAPDYQCCLTLIKPATKCSGRFDAAIWKWEAKFKVDQTFPTFHLLLTKEFSKATTLRQMAQSVWYGFANNTKTTYPFTYHITKLVLEQLPNLSMKY